MASVRLRADQIKRLRESGQPAATIRYALRRWKRGDFVIGSKPKRKKNDDLLQVFPLWKELDGVEDWQLRVILDQHWKVRDEIMMKKCEREIAQCDKIIAEMMRNMPPFIIDGNNGL